MTVSSDTILGNAARLLGDETNTRWPVDVLLAWLNEAQNRIATDVPTASTTVGDISCVAGARQSLPAGGIVPLGVDGLRVVDKVSLDREAPAWQNSTPSDTTTMWMRSPTNQTEFYLYPPRIGGTLADMEYGVLPTVVTMGDAISLPDRFAEPITDYIVSRGLSEDTDLQEPGRAETFLAAFKSATGVK